VLIDWLMYAQEAGAPASGTTAAPSPGGGLTSMLPFLLVMFAIMYFLMIRPNQKRERERRQMLDTLAKGDQVVTTGGICGTVVGTSDKSVVLKVSDDPVTKIEFVRSAVAQVIREEVTQEAPKK
jgi:preprotein translocase subunit YajC